VLKRCLPEMVAILAAAGAFALGVHWGTFAAGGSDSA